MPAIGAYRLLKEGKFREQRMELEWDALMTIASGEYAKVTLPTDVEVGDPFLIGALYCVAAKKGKSQEQTLAVVNGILEAKKTDANYVAYMAGDTVKINADARVTNDSANQTIGIAVEDSDTSMPFVRTLLCQVPAP